MAVKGAIRCDIETSLAEDRVVSIFEDTLGKRRRAKELIGNPSNWNVVKPPSNAATAVEWVRNKREERRAAIKPDSFIDATLQLHLGTTIALSFDEVRNGRTHAHLFTSILHKDKKGRVNPMAVATVRNQIKRVARAVAKEDPSATVSQYEDDD